MFMIEISRDTKHQNHHIPILCKACIIHMIVLRNTTMSPPTLLMSGAAKL